MAGRSYDHAQRRHATRRGRMRGCYVYIPAEQLERTGYSLDDPPPWYRVWGSSRGRVVVQLYKER
jgi:hypothetical protein